MPSQYPYPVSAVQIGWTPGAAEFEPLVASALGDAATDADGFPQVFNTAMLNLASDGNEGPILDQHLADMDFAPGGVDAGNYAPIALDLAAFHAGGDSALAGVETDTGAGSGAAGGTPPNPNPPGGAPPPSQGGGGSGGGQPPPPPAPCTVNDFPGFHCDALVRIGPYKKGDPPQVYYQGFIDKAEANAITRVTSVALLSGDTSVFSVAHAQNPGQPPGEGDQLQVTVQTSKTGRFNAVVRAITNYYPAGHVICICADVYQP